MSFRTWLRLIRGVICDMAFGGRFATEGDLAKAAGLHVSTIHNFRVGFTKEPRMSTVFKLCRAVDLDLDVVKEGYAETIHV